MPAKRSARRKASSRSSRVSFLTFLTGFLKNHFLLLTLLLLLTLTVGGLATANLSGRSSAAGSIRDLMKFKLGSQVVTGSKEQECAKNTTYSYGDDGGCYQLNGGVCGSGSNAYCCNKLVNASKCPVTTTRGEGVSVECTTPPKCFVQVWSNEGGGSKVSQDYNLTQREQATCNAKIEDKCKFFNSPGLSSSCGQTECGLPQGKNKFLCKPAGSCQFTDDASTWCKCIPNARSYSDMQDGKGGGAWQCLAEYNSQCQKDMTTQPTSVPVAGKSICCGPGSCKGGGTFGEDRGDMVHSSCKARAEDACSGAYVKDHPDWTGGAATYPGC